MRKMLLTIMLLANDLSLAQQPTQPQQQQAQPSAQQKLEQTCSSIKLGEIKDPPAQLLATCKALEDERAKKEEETNENFKFWAGKYCGAPWAQETPERARMHQTLLRLLPTLGRQYPGQKIAYIAVKSPVINAWTAPGQTTSYVCMPTAMIDFMSSDGELAFIMGHETGHAVDGACKGSKHDKAVQRVCESRADAVGFDLLVKSGFSAYEASAAFGKLEMYTGDINTDQRARLQALNNDHPMTPDRIKQMRDMLAQYNKVLKGPLSH